MNPTLYGILTRPLTDTFHGLDRCLTAGWKHLLWVCAGLLVGWWIYVPIHELLHAWACQIAGGEVFRLEIQPMYGGSLLASWLPYVTPGGDYAGRLENFDDHGSDLIYLFTVLGPYLLTVFPGVWLLRLAAQRRASLLFGLVLPVALAPIVAITGDGYEIGSLAVTQLAPWASPEWIDMLRGDDVVRKLAQLVGDSASLRAWTGLVLSLLVGLLWAILVYALGDLLTRQLKQPEITPLSVEDGLA